jgi:hypothetical protein
MFQNWNKGLKSFLCDKASRKINTISLYLDTFAENDKDEITEIGISACLHLCMRKNDGWAKSVGKHA